MNAKKCIVAVLFGVLTGLPILVWGQPLEVGQQVIVVLPGKIETLNQSKAEVFLGLPLIVQDIKDDKILVSNGNPGWLDSRNVLPAMEALELFEELLVDKPGDTTLLSVRATALSTVNRLEEAIAEFGKLIELKPNETSYRNERAGCYIRKGEQEKAIADFDEILNQRPSAPIYQNRGSCKLKLLDLDGARKDFVAACDLDPTFATSWLMLGRVDLQKQRPAEAIMAFDKYLALIPTDADTWFERGNLHVQLDQPEEALTAFEEAVRLQPKEPAYHRNRALSLKALGKSEQAIEAFSLMIKEFPDEMTGFVNRASIYQSAGKYEQALEDFTSALNVSPNSAYCFFHRGLVQIALNNIEVGIADLTRAVELDPKPQGFIKRGEVYASIEKFELALADFSKALEIDIDQSMARYRRGIVFVSLGREKEAMSDFTHLVDAGAKSADLFHRRGLLFREQKDWSGAKADFESAVEIEPNRAWAVNDLAWLLATAADDSLRDAPRAIELANRSCEITKWQNASMMDTLATAYAAAGEFDKAIEWSQKALSQENVNFPDGTQKRLQLFKERKPYVEK